MSNKPCKHIWNCHRQCQWCHRMQKDIEYEDGMAALRNLFSIVAPQCEPFDTLTGLVSQIDNYIAGIQSDLLRNESRVYFLEGNIACIADVVNTWCRECGVPECKKPFDDLALRNTIDTLLVKVSPGYT